MRYRRNSGPCFAKTWSNFAAIFEGRFAPLSHCATVLGVEFKPGNKFRRTLADVGLTSEQVTPNRRVTYEMMERYWPAVVRGGVQVPPAVREWAVKLDVNGRCQF